MIEIIRRRRNVWAGEQNVCFGQFIVYIIPSGFPSVSVSDNFFVESYFHTFLSKSDTSLVQEPVLEGPETPVREEVYSLHCKA
jgi:hypothetical protein